MKQALISPKEKVYKYDGTLLGERVAEVSETTFEVASPLFWITCSDNALADVWYFDPETSQLHEVPIQPKPVVVTDTPQVI